MTQSGSPSSPLFRIVAEDLAFPEGPLELPGGDVALVEIRAGTVTRIASDGRKTVIAKTGGGPNGAALGPDGAIYVTLNGGFSWNPVTIGGETMILPGGSRLTISAVRSSG